MGLMENRLEERDHPLQWVNSSTMALTRGVFQCLPLESIHCLGEENWVLQVKI